MAIRRIMVLGEDDVLRKHARRVDKFDKRLRTLLDDMRGKLPKGLKLHRNEGAKDFGGPDARAPMGTKLTQSIKASSSASARSAPFRWSP